MQIFGSESAFGIAYSPVEEYNFLINCNLILNGCLIGYTPSYEMLGLCMWDLERLKSRIVDNEGKFRNHLFDTLTEREIVELVYKSNQLEEEFDPHFRHLPVLPTNDLWYMHTVDLAETTQNCRMVVFEEDNKLKFLWDNYEGCKPQGKLKAAVVEHIQFYSAIEQFLTYLNDSIHNGLHSR